MAFLKNWPKHFAIYARKIYAILCHRYPVNRIFYFDQVGYLFITWLNQKTLDFINIWTWAKWVMKIAKRFNSYILSTWKHEAVWLTWFFCLDNRTLRRQRKLQWIQKFSNNLIKLVAKLFSNISKNDGVYLTYTSYVPVLICLTQK